MADGDTVRVLTTKFAMLPSTAISAAGDVGVAVAEIHIMAIGIPGHPDSWRAGNEAIGRSGDVPVDRN
jgi:hypothetical protein